jgi:hypothetical protein
MASTAIIEIRGGAFENTMTRDRGTYGPLDRDRNWIVGWASDHAVDQAVDYARDRTVGAALRPAMPYVSDAFRAGRGAQQWWAASRAIGGRTEAEKPVAQIGQELFHTVADRDRALAHLSTGFRALVNDLAVWQTSNKDHPEASKTAQWLAADVTPALEEWRAFVFNARSWWTKRATSWETFEGWWDRLKQLRCLARAHGITLQSAEPVPLPKTIWQKSAEGMGSEATAVLGVLKIGAFTALGIMGFAGLYAAIRSLRSRTRSADEQAALRQIVREEVRGASPTKK